MKKLIAIILALLSVCSILACGGDKYADLKINVDGFGRNLIKSCTFDYQADVLEDADTAAANLKIDPALLNTVDGKPEIFYSVVAGFPEGVFVIGAKDAASAKTISEGPVKDWLKYNRDGYSTYGPEQVPKIDSAINRVCGRYVIVIVSADNKAAGNVLNGLLDSALKIS